MEYESFPGYESVPVSYQPAAEQAEMMRSPKHGFGGGHYGSNWNQGYHGGYGGGGFFGGVPFLGGLAGGLLLGSIFSPYGGGYSQYAPPPYYGYYQPYPYAPYPPYQGYQGYPYA